MKDMIHATCGGARSGLPRPDRRRLFAVGPVTKAAFWEMTAVPDIRRQCEFLGEFLAAQTGAPVFTAPETPEAKPRGVRLPTAVTRQRSEERLAFAG